MTTDWDAVAYGERFGFVSQLAEDLVGLLDPRPGERIVDLGCGTGTLAARIAACGADVLGIDADASMVEAARAQHPELRFEVVSAYDFTLESPVDAVFSNAALHWMTRPEDVLRRVAAALRPGGRFVAEMGGAGNVATVESALRDALARHGVPRDRQLQPWYFPTVAEYTALLERHGFEVRAAWHFGRPTPLAGGDSGLRDWLAMFASRFIEPFAAAERAAIAAEVEAAVRGELYAGGRWHVDYRRLRFVAVRTEGSG